MERGTVGSKISGFHMLILKCLLNKNRQFQLNIWVWSSGKKASARFIKYISESQQDHKISRTVVHNAAESSELAFIKH